MGSEMCIRDRHDAALAGGIGRREAGAEDRQHRADIDDLAAAGRCLLYTSDAADERSRVDLGGRRLIKNKNKVVRRERARAET